MSASSPLLSVVCPVFNEESYIENVLNFFTQAHPKEKELLIIDGGSTDKTREIIANWISRNQNIYLYNNPQQYVSFALNIVIPLCKGNYIVRLDAHTEYSNDYFEKILETFEKENVNIVGGPMRVQGKTPYQKAVAKATSCYFGIGNSQFHFTSYRGLSDSVYLGAWEKKIFEKTGLFDEMLVRNQDDEFHYRAKSLGFLIYLNPDIKSYYYPRSTLKSLFRQYFQYGIYKPLVLWKIKSEIKLRHLAPSVFVLYLAGIPVWLYWNILLSVPLLLYVLLNLYFSLKNNLPLKVKMICLLVYPTLHIAYGLGFLIGLFKLPYHLNSREINQFPAI